jgi:hypothetical protein
MMKARLMSKRSMVLQTAGALLILIACFSPLYAYDYDDPYGAEPGGAQWYQENAGAIAHGEFSQLPTPSATAASYIPNLTEFTQGYNDFAGSNLNFNTNVYGLFEAPLDAGFVNDPYGAEPGGALWYQENAGAIVSGEFTQLPTPSAAAITYSPGIDNYVDNYNLTSGTNPFINNQLNDLFAIPDTNDPWKDDIFQKFGGQEDTSDFLAAMGANLDEPAVPINLPVSTMPNGPEIDSVMMGEGFQWNEIADFVEQGYKDGTVDVTLQPFNEKMAAMQPQERDQYLAAITREAAGIIKPYEQKEVSVANKDIQVFLAPAFREQRDGTAGLAYPGLNSIVIDTKQAQGSIDSLRSSITNPSNSINNDELREGDMLKKFVGGQTDQELFTARIQDTYNHEVIHHTQPKEVLAGNPEKQAYLGQLALSDNPALLLNELNTLSHTAASANHKAAAREVVKEVYDNLGYNSFAQEKIADQVYNDKVRDARLDAYPDISPYKPNHPLNASSIARPGSAEVSKAVTDYSEVIQNKTYFTNSFMDQLSNDAIKSTAADNYTKQFGPLPKIQPIQVNQDNF